MRSNSLLACGIVSSTCGQLVAYPLVVLRTRLQAQGMPGRPVLYSGMFDCFSKIVGHEGYSALYRGTEFTFFFLPSPGEEAK